MARQRKKPVKAAKPVKPVSVPEIGKDINPEELRARAIVACRSYRSSWVNLAILLEQIKYGGDYREWGYDDFYDYCQRELVLKDRQAKKMLVAYSYLKKKYPDMLPDDSEGTPGAQLPGYEVLVDLESASRQVERYDHDKLNEIEANVISGQITGREASQSINGARKVQSKVEPDGDEKSFRKLILTARNLRHDVVRCHKVPDDVCKRFEAIMKEIEALG